MPNFSGKWNLQGQLTGIKAGTWTGVPFDQELYSFGNGGSGRLATPDVDRSSPIQVGSDENWTFVAAGGANGFALKTDGTLWAWGNAGSGRLATPDVDRSSPIQIASGLKWSQISTGNAHFLGVTPTGQLWAWGDAGSGRLGNNASTFANVSSPTQIGALTNWHQVSAGFAHTLAVKTDGTLWSWGDDGTGRLGLNQPDTNRSSPVQVGALTNWSKVSAGGFHSVALKTDGTLWVWGNAGNGRLGNNADTTQDISSPIQIGSETNWSKIIAGEFNSYAITTEGELYSWGVAVDGRLGLNTSVNRSSPVQVGALTNWREGSALYNHCLFVKTDNTLWAWGNNSSGQLGDNSRISRSSPIHIGSDTDWNLPAAGDFHSHAIKLQRKGMS